ncbi:MAG: PIN domain-containing protein [bacterium]|nr:PIN domain-containing protein [bacterium]MCM1374298.1 PIN domain-containing protein [Muribaculum sp.]
MKLLIDTNIVLDVLLQREPFFRDAVKVLNLAQYDDVHEYVSASAITDIYYIAHKQIKDRKLVLDLIKRLLMVVSIAAVTEQEIRNALEIEWKDFEDAVQYSVALLNEMEGLVTRNPGDYERTDISIWSPEQVLKMYGDKKQG